MASNPISFPSPVGGVPFPSDFAPSLIFVGLYASLVPLIIYRVSNKKSRNALLISSMFFATERTVVFILRAIQAHNLEARESTGLNAYMQSTLSFGFISMTEDLIKFTRLFLVNTTKVTESITPSPAPPSVKQSASSQEIPLVPMDFTDRPDLDRFRMRQRFRRITIHAFIVLAVALILSIVSGSQYSKGISNKSIGNQTYRLRYASCAIALSIAISVGAMVAWAWRRFSRAKREAGCILTVLTVLISIIAIYRLVVMANTTTSLTSTDPGSLNSPGAKATFYVLHVLPEWIWMVTLFGFNFREIFETGPLGRYVDPDEPEGDGFFAGIRDAYKRRT